MIKNKVVNITILAILLSSTNSFADSPASTMSNTASTKATTDTGDISQNIIDDFYTYAGTIKPEIREEIKKYREGIVTINKKKRDLYNSLSQEAQNFLAEQQKYKKKISASKESQQPNQQENSSKDKPK